MIFLKNNIVFQLGKSLLNLATLLTGSESNEPKIETSKPKPKDTPILPRRPPRRKLSQDRSRNKSLTGEQPELCDFVCNFVLRGADNQFRVEETIAEVESPADSPTLEREPKVRMPGDTLRTGDSSRKPSVPQPGQPRVPSPTSTVNTLELIGSPVITRPRVQQPGGDPECVSLSPRASHRTPKYENTAAGAEPAVAMPGTPSQSVKVGTGQTCPAATGNCLQSCFYGPICSS